MNDSDLERYSRQLLVPGVEFDGQEALAASAVLIVGCGGLGCPVALYLAGAGVGHIRLMDDDVVELSNLPRQIAYTNADIGRPKAEALAERLRAMNDGVTVSSEVRRFDAVSGPAALAGVDLVIDASDSRESRLHIDQLTAARGLPWIMASAIQMSGQIVAFAPDRRGGCYHCLSPDNAGVTGTCRDLGVLGPVVGAIGVAQAVDALRYLLAMGDMPWAELRLHDFRSGEQHTLELTPRTGCPVCALAADIPSA